MIESSASYRNYAGSEQPKVHGERLPAGAALLATFGLSLLGWAFVLVPLIGIFH
jgi:hypothetical protein